MAGPYTPPRLSEIPVPDLFTLIAQDNPQRPLVQIIREHTDTPTDSITFTWAEVIQHAQNAAADLRGRWAENQDNVERHTVQPREPGSPLVVAGVLANNGYELYVNILACILNRWTVCYFPVGHTESDVDMSSGIAHFSQEQSGRYRASTSHVSLRTLSCRGIEHSLWTHDGRDRPRSDHAEDCKPGFAHDYTGFFASYFTQPGPTQERNDSSRVLYTYVWFYR